MKVTGETRGAVPRRMGEMMDRLHVDVAAFARSAGATSLATAARACGACENSATCASWLDGDATVPGPAAFCPNAARFGDFVTR